MAVEKDFSVIFKDKWDEESFDGENETIIEVQYDKGSEKPVYIELRDVVEDEINDLIGIDLTKEQAIELAYSLLRINWDLEKGQPIASNKVGLAIANKNSIAYCGYKFEKGDEE
jgi:hypothetical protein